jgi:V/A-type H+-transporting ATPase subunit E
MSASSYSSVQADGFKKLVDAVFEEVRAKSEMAIKEALQKSISILEESEKFSQSKSQEIISSYKETSEIEARKEISKAEIESRMYLLKLKESYIEAVLKETKKKLQSMVGTPEYKSLMMESLKSVSNSVATGQVLMNKQDFEMLGMDNIKKVFGTEISVKTQPIGTGGFIIITKDGKASVDLTIDSILDSERQSIRGKIADILFG